MRNVRSILAFRARRADFFDIWFALVDFSFVNFILEFRLFDDLIFAWKKNCFKISILEKILEIDAQKAENI